MDVQDAEMFQKLSSRVHVLERDFADFKKNRQDMIQANNGLVDRLLNQQGKIEELTSQLSEPNIVKLTDEESAHVYFCIGAVAERGVLGGDSARELFRIVAKLRGEL